MAIYTGCSSIQLYYHQHHQIQLDKEWITLCYGTVSTLHYIVQAFCDRGDCVIIQTPVIEPFYHAIQAHGATCIEHELYIDTKGRYAIDFQAFEALLCKHKPKVYFLCNPHNPSGRVWSASELQQLLLLCHQYAIQVVADEVHSGMIYKLPFTSISTYLTKFENLILLSSPNKKYNIGGLKTSFAIIKNEHLRTVFQTKLKQNSITSPSVFGIRALIACLTYGDTWSTECLAYVKNNYVYMTTFFKHELPMLSFMDMESSFLLWVDIRGTNIRSDVFTAELAKEYGVLVESGTHFVGNGEGWIRINLGTQLANVKACCQRIKLYIDNKTSS